MERKINNNVTINSKMNNEKTSLIKKCEEINCIDDAEVKNNRGITLLACVITVTVLIILAVVTYNLTFGNSGIITRANESKYMTILAQFKDEVELFKAEKLLENPDFNANSLTAGYSELNYEPQPEGETGTIYDVIPSLQGSIFDGKIEIIKGELLLNSTEMDEIRVAQTLGIQVNPYLIDENRCVTISKH